MPAICLHFHIHIPVCVREYHFFDLGNTTGIADEAETLASIKRFVHNTFLPTTRVLENLLQRHNGKFRLALSISGTTMRYVEKAEPEALLALQALTDTGHLEWINYPYYNSLSFLHDRKEFTRQLTLQGQAIERLFNQKPQILCNTHLIYNNFLAYFASMHGYKGILCEGVPGHFPEGTGNEPHIPSDGQKISLLLRHAALSEDLAFRFSQTEWEEYPLKPENFAHTLASTPGKVILLSMNFNIFEHHAAKGILPFLNFFPEKVLALPHMQFLTPSEALEEFPAQAKYHALEATSWAWPERSAHPWNGNAMQQEALEKLYALGGAVQKSQDPAIWEDWSLLQDADHFSNMKESESRSHGFQGTPYGAYASFMNMLTDLQLRLNAKGKTSEHEGVTR